MRKRALGLGVIVAIVAAVALVVSRPGVPNVSAIPIDTRDVHLGPPCSPLPNVDLGRTVEVQVLTGDGVGRGEVQPQLQAAASFFAPYGVRVVQWGADASLGVDGLLVGSEREIDDALVAQGIAPDGGDSPQLRARSRQIVCEVALRPVREVLREVEAGRAPGRIHVVMLRRIAEPGSALERALPDLRGLTLSAHATSPALAECLGEIGDHAPLVMLGLDAIAGRRPGTVDVTLAHEMGHALGLEHARTAEDLMSVDPPGCVPVLSPTQIDVLRATPP